MRKILLHSVLPALAFAPAFALAGAAPVQPDPVPLAMQQLVIAYFSPAMVLPATTIWHFYTAKPFLLGGTVVCGDVNYQNSRRRYLGVDPFYAVVKDGKVNDGGMKTGNKMLDPEGSVDFSYDQHCGQN